MPKWNFAEIVSIRDLSPTVKQFLLRPKEKVGFIPGQFITIDFPISDKRTKRWRSYSIANTADDDLIELCIVSVPNGLATTFLWEHAEVGLELSFKSPAGTFTLPKNLERDLVMICTGTGVAPFRSMIRHVFHNNIAFKKMHLIFGGRNEEDILYREEFEAYASENTAFFYDIALSRQKDWNGYRGYLHQIYLEKYSEVDPSSLFMICGWSEMIDEAVANLLVHRKLNRSQIVYELYG